MLHGGSAGAPTVSERDGEGLGLFTGIYHGGEVTLGCLGGFTVFAFYLRGN